MFVMKTVLKWIGLTLIVVVLLLALMIAYWAVRPNRSQVSEDLIWQAWDVVSDDSHNSNTDMIFWRDQFYLVYASSPFHFASDESKLHVLRSPNTRQWLPLATFDPPGEDIRDPKFAVIQDRLFLYALKNTEFTAEPYTTVYSVSDDGLEWSAFQEVEPQGWLFWRPKSADGQTWYVPAYWYEHGESILLRSTDGVNWEKVAQIYAGDRNDETAIEFLPDGRMIATARLEVSDNLFGHPEGSTLIAVAEPPYENWTVTARSKLTRLDGPNLFSYNDRVYAVGRYQPVVRGPFEWQGSIFTRKRTALFLVREDGLVYISDLPSAGDTSYAGAVVRDDSLYTCYYTNDVRRDFTWILGMVRPSDIPLAWVDLPSLEALTGEGGSE
jgi:hypothetical protein